MATFTLTLPFKDPVYEDSVFKFFDLKKALDFANENCKWEVGAGWHYNEKHGLHVNFTDSRQPVFIQENGIERCIEFYLKDSSRNRWKVECFRCEAEATGEEGFYQTSWVVDIKGESDDKISLRCETQYDDDITLSEVSEEFSKFSYTLISCMLESRHHDMFKGMFQERAENK